MKAILKISICLNVGLLGALVFVMASQRKEVAATSRASTETMPSTVVVATKNSFRWSQLESTNDYRIYVANLRAVGCPEPTVQDIVKGNVERAFSFERNQLGLDGSGAGEWSRLREARLVAELLGERTLVAEETTAAPQSVKNRSQPNGETEVAQATVGSQNVEQPPNNPTGTQNAEQQSYSVSSAPSYPLAFQNVNMDALGFNATQKAAIAQVQQQFINDIGGPNQNPDDPAYLPKWQKAQINADDTLRGLLGNQAYMAYEQQLYYQWYQPQVTAANADDQTLTINPALFSD